MSQRRPRNAMLDELMVENLGLIANARFEPGPGLVVISGETGAGKTLLLGALRLLRGEPGRKDRIGPAGEEVAVEARFVADEDDVAVRRTVGPDRSRAYVDGSIAGVGELARRTGSWIEIVGQHDHLAMTDAAGLRDLVDGGLSASGGRALRTYRSSWTALAEVVASQEELGGDRRELERALDTARFQASEIEAAAFGPGDDTDLESRAARLRNAEELGALLASAADGVGEETTAHGVAVTVQTLRQAARIDPSFDDLADQAHAAADLLHALSSDIERVATDLDRDPERLADVEQRLALLGDLRRKYGNSLEAILAFGEAAEARAAHLSDLLQRADEITEEISSHRLAVGRAAESLRKHRRVAAKSIADGAMRHLIELGFEDPVVKFSIVPTDPGPGGADAIELRFASDRSLPAGPVGKVASGGELSRLVLALRLAGGAGRSGIVAFDEVDAGVGGVTALALGRKLADIASGRQVFCVTHLPQVAAFADRHFVVRRNDSRAEVRLLDGEARLEELSRMLAGLPESDKGRDHAAELLAIAQAT